MPVGGLPRLGLTQTITAAAATSAALTTAFSAQCMGVQLAAAGAVRFTLYSGAVTAQVSATTSPLLPAGQVMRIAVSPGMKIAAQGDSITTVLFVTELD